MKPVKCKRCRDTGFHFVEGDNLVCCVSGKKFPVATMHPSMVLKECPDCERKKNEAEPNSKKGKKPMRISDVLIESGAAYRFSVQHEEGVDVGRFIKGMTYGDVIGVLQHIDPDSKGNGTSVEHYVRFVEKATKLEPEGICLKDSVFSLVLKEKGRFEVSLPEKRVCMNARIANFARKALKESLSRCTRHQQDLFRGRYSSEDMECPVGFIVDKLESDRLSQAMDIVEEMISLKTV